MLADPYMLAKMSDQWRLARGYGIANLLIMHKIADRSCPVRPWHAGQVNIDLLS